MGVSRFWRRVAISGTAVLGVFGVALVVNGGCGRIPRRAVEGVRRRA